MDLFVVPTIFFRPVYGLLIMGHGQRQILWFGVTAHPTAEWIANQLTEACGWEQIPRYPGPRLFAITSDASQPTLIEDLASESMDAVESRGNVECKSVTGKTARRVRAAVEATRANRQKRLLP
jgi:hypothetical protein